MTVRTRISRRQFDKTAAHYRSLHRAFRSTARSHRRSFCDRRSASMRQTSTRAIAKCDRLARRIDILFAKLTSVERVIHSWFRATGVLSRSTHIAIFSDWRDLVDQFEARVRAGRTRICTIFACIPRDSRHDHPPKPTRVDSTAARPFRSHNGSPVTSYIFYR